MSKTVLKTKGFNASTCVCGISIVKVYIRSQCLIFIGIQQIYVQTKLGLELSVYQEQLKLSTHFTKKKKKTLPYDSINSDINPLTIISWSETGGMTCDKCFYAFRTCTIIGILTFSIYRNKTRPMHLLFLYRKYMVYPLSFGVINLQLCELLKEQNVLLIKRRE